MNTITENIKNIIEISNYINIDIFRSKLYEFVYKLDNEYLMQLFDEIDFVDNNVDNIMIGDFFNKTFRNCSLLEKHECNQECYWSDTFLDKLKFWSSNCKHKNINDLLYDTYCSDFSYKTRYELIYLIKI